jgi:SNF2 family DNA or RNA helicase
MTEPIWAELRPYQWHGYNHILHNEDVIEAGGGILAYGIGTGKTLISWMAINTFIQDYGYGGSILIVGPLRVVEYTWPKEKEKWAQTAGLSISLITGDVKNRRQAYRRKADVYLVNRENLRWLVNEFGGKWPYKIIFADEFQDYKNHDADRTRALTQIRPQTHTVIGLTGTLAPNGLGDLFAPMRIVDQGRRLGKKLGEFRRNFMVPAKYTKKTGQPARITSYKVRSPEKEKSFLGEEYYEKVIADRIGDICIALETEDVVDLPPKIEAKIEFEFDRETKRRYDEFEREAVLQYLDKKITAVNAGALANKLVQFCNGAVYTTKPDYVEFHMQKIDVLDELLENLNGSPLLVIVNYKHDTARIQQYLKKYDPQLLTGPKTYDAWNDGQIICGCLHPRSGGAGLNLQFSGGNNIVWFGPNYSSEMTRQTNGRIYRPGIDRGVFINTLMATGTIEEDIFGTLDAKIKGEDRLIQAVKARIEKWR